MTARKRGHESGSDPRCCPRPLRLPHRGAVDRPSGSSREGRAVTEAEVRDIADRFRAAGRSKIPVEIDEWVALMLAKIRSGQ